jgi:hypothetical protein
LAQPTCSSAFIHSSIGTLGRSTSRLEVRRCST